MISMRNRKVQDNLENTLKAEGLVEAVDWIKLRESNLVSNGSQTAEGKRGNLHVIL